MCWSQTPKLNPPREKGFMDFDMFRGVVDQLTAFAKHGRISLSLSFAGESLLHPRFGEFLDYVVGLRKGGMAFELRLYTNGLLLNEHAEQLVRSRTTVCVSIHRPLNTQLTENILDYNRRRAEVSPVYGHLVAPLNGAMVLEEFGRDAKGAYEEYVPILDKVDFYHMYTEDLRRTDGAVPVPCREPFYYMAVLWNGDVVPCCHMLSSGSFSMGNVRDGLLDVWMGDRYVRLRDGDTRGFPCERCMIHRGIIIQSMGRARVK